MNDRQTLALKHLLEAGHPDARVTVTTEPDGVQVAISGPGVSPGSSRVGDAVLSLSLVDSTGRYRYGFRI